MAISDRHERRIAMIDRKSVRALNKQIKKMPELAERYVKEAMTKNGEEAVKYMRLLCPEDSGATEASIRYEVKDTSKGVALQIRAGDGEEAPARLVEYANNQPFFWPTIRLQGKRYRGRYRRAINKAAKEIANRG